MNKKRSQEKLSSDSLLTDGVLTSAAKIIEKQIEDDIKEREERNIDIPKELDEKLLNIVRQIDGDRKAEIRKNNWKSMSRVVATLLICLTCVGTLAVGTSDALRLKIFNLFSNDKTGSVTFHNNEEADAIGSWKNFWYPGYLPEGFELAASSEEEHFLLYQNKKDESEISVYEIDSDATLSLDNETSGRQKIKVGQYEGYMLSNRKAGNTAVVWLMDEKTVMMEFANLHDQDMILRIIDDMKYIN